MTLTSLIDSCGAGIWSLEIRLQNCPLNSDAGLALAGLAGGYPWFFSPYDAAYWAGQSLGNPPEELCSWVHGLDGLCGALGWVWWVRHGSVIASRQPHGCSSPLRSHVSGGYESKGFNMLTLLKAWLCFFSGISFIGCDTCMIFVLFPLYYNYF